MTDRAAVRRVFRVVNGGTPTSDEANWGGGLAWATPADLASVHGQRIYGTQRSLTERGLLGSGRVPAGSLILSTRAPIGYVAETTLPTAFNQGCRGLQALRPVDIRYFRYQFASLASDMHALGQGSTFQELSTESLSAIRLACPPELEQRAIADFLDDETVRIDALIAAKRRMLSVLEERRRNSLLNALRDRGLDVPRDGLLSLDWSVPPTWRVVRLSQVLVQLTNGYVGPTRDILVDEGVRYVQSLHIKGGKIDFDRSPYFVQRSWHDERPRIHLRPDDVLVVQTGDIGQVAVVPNDFGEASCHALQILRARRDMVSGEFLGGYLRSPIGYQSLLSMATGALHPHLEGSIRAIPVILPPLSVQVEVLREVAEASASMDRVTSLLARQIDLLVERRQALITSAVTGELEIPGVAA